MDDLKKEKEVAFYSACVTAWIETRMEYDKTIITLSATGIGLLVTLLSTVGIFGTFHLITVCIALFGFLSAIIITLYVFIKNSDYLENLVNNKSENIRLKKYDVFKNISFYVAVTFIVIAGIIFGVHNQQKGSYMNEEKKKIVKEEIKQRSLEGLDQLKPKPNDSTTNKTSEKKEKK